MLLQDDIENLQEMAAQRAIDIVSGNYNDIDSLMLSLKFILVKTYNIPLFSEYFENRTIPELLLEVALHKESSTPSITRTNELANKLDKEDVDDLFGDMIDEDDKKDEGILSEAELDNVYKEFMSTGKFTEEGE